MQKKEKEKIWGGGVKKKSVIYILKTACTRLGKSYLE